MRADTTMELKRFFNDDDAVSPVIGVILMVAITVILAAVIATFVLGLGDQVSNTAPQASFSTEYEDANDWVEFTHDGGDSIKASNLYLRGDIASGSDGDTPDITSDNTQWNGEASGSNSKIVAGNSVTVGVDTESFTINLVYQSATGDNSATLATASGPSA